jgi:hypothetical protein
MKKIMMMISLVWGFNPAHGQLQQGQVHIGGRFSFNKSTVADYNAAGNNSFIRKGFSAEPSIGYFLKKNFLVGASFLYTKQQSIKENEGSAPIEDSKTITNGYGIFATRYIPLWKKCYFTAQANLYYENSQEVVINTAIVHSRKNTQSSSVSLSPGFTYAVHKRLLLEVALKRMLYVSYDRMVTKDGSGKLENTTDELAGGFVDGTNIPLFVGVRFQLIR